MAEGDEQQRPQANPSVEDALRDTQKEGGRQVVQGVATTTAVGAAAGAVSGAAGAAATGALGGAGAATAGGAAAGASAGASSALAAAWPLAVLVGIYLAYRGYREAKKAVGTNLSEAEVSASVDILGIGNKIPKEIPNELRGDKILGKIFGSAKTEQQLFRDRWRLSLEKAGFAQKTESGNHFIELADGSFYDIGLDGRNSIPTFDPNAAVDDLGPGQFRPYDIDTSNPLSQQALGFINPIAAMSTGGTEDLQANAAGILTNATLANASTIEEAQANARFFYDKIFGAAANEAGVSVEEVALGSLQALFDQGAISEDEFVAYSNGIRQTYGQSPLTPPGTELDQDPSQPIGDLGGDPADGFVDNTATAGVILDTGTDTIGAPSDDTIPSIGDEDNLVPRPQGSPAAATSVSQQQDQGRRIADTTAPKTSVPQLQADGARIAETDGLPENIPDALASNQTQPDTQAPKPEVQQDVSRPAVPIFSPEQVSADHGGFVPPPEGAAPADSAAQAQAAQAAQAQATSLQALQEQQVAAAAEARAAAEEAQRKATIVNLGQQEINKQKSLTSQTNTGRGRRADQEGKVLIEALR